jgi:hypothetical protein
MQELFSRIASKSDNHVIDCSLQFLEIYNENCRDLLSVSSGNGSNLDLREDERGVTVVGLSMHSPRKVEDVMRLLYVQFPFLFAFLKLSVCPLSNNMFCDI